MDEHRNPLAPELLRRTVNPRLLGIGSSEEAPSVAGLIGQDRAVQSLQFALGMKSEGFNVYVAGPPGIGKMTAVRKYLESASKERPTPSDWCYVYNFRDPYQPQAIELPAGKGRELEADMRRLLDLAQREIPSAFESEEYRAKREQIEASFLESRSTLFQGLADTAAKQDFGLQVAPFGIALIPLREGKPMTEAEFEAQPEPVRETFAKNRASLDTVIKETMKAARQLKREADAALAELDRQVALFVVGDLVDDLVEKYAAHAPVVEYLEAVRGAILEDISLFRRPEEPAPLVAPFDGREADTDHLRFRRFHVNVLVDNQELKGAPVVVELNPSFPNLFGKVEKESRFGALYADFTQIKSGSLHRANGGYLVLPVESLLRNILSWDGLKRSLRTKVVEIEDVAERLGYISTRGLKPQPIPIDIKVVLIGQRYVQHLLVEFDEEYAELFKVRADFDTLMPSTPETQREFLGFLHTYCESGGIRRIDPSGCAAILEFAMRLAEDQERLSTQFGRIADVICEANHWAERARSKSILGKHVHKALEQRIYRSRMVQDRINDWIVRGTLLIETDGERIGQVNGLSVLTTGDYSFGRPSRITARVGPGGEGVIDIEREVEMGGPIHSKGVLILGGYLLGRYMGELPHALSARVVFEQSYEGVEGDSASCAELLALLSELSGVPLAQGVAVTGSVNQHGDVQAIGGVNEKIEGFFEVCHARGLTGRQGVVIPRANVKNLMLRPEVAAAAAKGKFHVWAVEHVDQAAEILTGVVAGERGPSGLFPEGTLNDLVEARLNALAAIAANFAGGGPATPEGERPRPRGRLKKRRPKSPE